MSGLFSQLAGKFSGYGTKFQAEDFFTEIFAFLLANEPVLCLDWLKTLCADQPWASLLENGAPPWVSTQQVVGNDSRLDMVVELTCAEKRIRFVFEHKLGSDEGSGQLSKYAKHLINAGADFGMLVFLTQHPNLKDRKGLFKDNGNEFAFRHLRWHSVHQFLSGWPGSSVLVREALQYMTDSGLTMEKQFTPEHILALSVMPRVFKMMDEAINSALPKFDKVLDGKSQTSTWSTGFQKWGRYMVYREPTRHFWTGMGFWSPQGESLYPSFGVEMQVGPNHPRRDEIMKAMQVATHDRDSDWKGYNLQGPPNWSGITHRKSLNQILQELNHLEAVSKYFDHCLDKVNAFKEGNPGLPWGNP